jgi:hypothetical protein
VHEDKPISPISSWPTESPQAALRSWPVMNRRFSVLSGGDVVNVGDDAGRVAVSL